jgi:uncharacterized protein YjbI with pentapeptide repeats
MAEPVLTRADVERLLVAVGNSTSQLDLSWRNLQSIDLSEFNLSRANLHRATLVEANLSKANPK